MLTLIFVGLLILYFLSQFQHGSFIGTVRNFSTVIPAATEWHLVCLKAFDGLYWWMGHNDCNKLCWDLPIHSLTLAVLLLPWHSHHSPPCAKLDSQLNTGNYLNYKWKIGTVTCDIVNDPFRVLCPYFCGWLQLLLCWALSAHLVILKCS